MISITTDCGSVGVFNAALLLILACSSPSSWYLSPARPVYIGSLPRRAHTSPYRERILSLPTAEHFQHKRYSMRRTVCCVEGGHSSITGLAPKQYVALSSVTIYIIPDEATLTFATLHCTALCFVTAWLATQRLWEKHHGTWANLHGNRHAFSPVSVCGTVTPLPRNLQPILTLEAAIVIAGKISD